MSQVSDYHSQEKRIIRFIALLFPKPAIKEMANILTFWECTTLMFKPPRLDLSQEKLEKWMEKGAIISEGLRKILPASPNRGEKKE